MAALDRLAAAHQAAGDLPAAIAVGVPSPGPRSARRGRACPADGPARPRRATGPLRLRQYRLVRRDPGPGARGRAARVDDRPVRGDPGCRRARRAAAGARAAARVRGRSTQRHGARATPSALVGRDVAIDTLVDGLRVGRRRSGAAIAAITGEAGIGKTRLAEAVRRPRSAPRAARSLRRAPTSGERGIAYGPIVELLRSATRRTGRRRAPRRPDVRSELARLLPALDPGGRPGRTRADGPGAHARLVAAIADGLTALTAGPVPGCIWIDDLQWADGATLEALDYLARRLAGRSDARVAGLASGGPGRGDRCASSGGLDRTARDRRGARAARSGRGRRTGRADDHGPRRHRPPVRGVRRPAALCRRGPRRRRCGAHDHAARCPGRAPRAIGRAPERPPRRSSPRRPSSGGPSTWPRFVTPAVGPRARPWTRSMSCCGAASSGNPGRVRLRPWRPPRPRLRVDQPDPTPAAASPRRRGVATRPRREWPR